MNTKQSVRYWARLSILAALIIVFTLFNIGNIPVGPIVATIYHIPVVIGAVILGTQAGVILGGLWGLLCFILAITGQTTDIVALTAVGQSPFLYFLVAFIPRIAVGVVTALVFKGFLKLFKEKKFPAYVLAGCIGSLTNTVLYLGMLYVLFTPLLAEVFSISTKAVFAMVAGVAGTNGVVEAVVSAIITGAVCAAVNKLVKTGD